MDESFAQNRKESKGVMAFLAPLAISFFISPFLMVGILLHVTINTTEKTSEV
jgi:hypothetical protein